MIFWGNFAVFTKNSYYTKSKLTFFHFSKFMIICHVSMKMAKKMQFSPFFSVIHAKLQQSQTVAAVLPSCQVGLKLILTIFLFVKVLCKPLKKLANFQKSKHFHKKIFFHFLTITQDWCSLWNLNSSGWFWCYSILSFNYQHCPSVMCRTPFY